MAEDFPKHVFEDIRGSDFEKYNKKGVSEDFVTENFKDVGWYCYRPVDDTGIDLVARKNVCPCYHTRWNDKPEERCETCQTDLITITRFIQIKAREEKDDQIGVTLDSKDFRGDPRHVFLFYGDATNDFFIMPIYSYLRIFKEHEALRKTTFGNPSFRRENNRVYYKKIMSAAGKYEYVWTGGGANANLSKYMNTNGIEILSNPYFDINLDSFCAKISKMRFDILHDYSSGDELKHLLEATKRKVTPIQNSHKRIIKKWQNAATGSNAKKIHFKKKNESKKKLEDAQAKVLLKMQQLEKTYQDFLDKKASNRPDDILAMRRRNRDKFRITNQNNNELIQSVNDYWKLFRGLEPL